MLRRIALALCGVIVATFALAQTPNENILRMHAGVHPTYFCNYTLGQFCGGEAYSTTSLRTVTDATGAITYAPNNLLTYSNTFSNAAWLGPHVSKVDGVATPPAGFISAGTITASAGSAFHYINGGISSGVEYLFTFYVHRNNNDWMFFTLTDSKLGYFNTATGLFGTVPGGYTTTSASVGGGWYRISVAGLSADITGHGLGLANANGGANFVAAGTEAVDVAGASFAQVTYETTPRPGDQVITTSAVYYGPAFDYNATTLSPLWLRVEEARTNLFLNSNAPATQTITVASGSAYSISFYGTGVLTLSGALTQVMTGGAYPTRTTYTGTTSTTSLVVTVTTLGTMSYPQVELGGFVTSAIHTAGSSVTRAADVVTLQGPVAGLLGATNRSVIVEASGWPGSSPNRLLADGSGALALVSSTTQVGTFNGSTILSAALGSSTTAGAFRAGVSLLPGKRYICGNGGSLASDNNSYTPTGSMFLGSNGSAYFFDGHISKLAIYSRALTGPQLQSRTVLGAPF